MDPTLIYILLTVGLWVGATSFFIPGTGIAEISAVALLGFAFYGLAALPTNWAAVLLLVMSAAAFILIPLVLPRYSRYAEVALAAQGFGGLFLFQEGLRPNLLAVALILAVAFAYNRFLLVPLMGQMQAAPSMGDERELLNGAPGRVTSAVRPPAAGTAYINGESWTIRATDPLAPGDTVRVVEVRGLELIVERAKPKRTPLPVQDTDTDFPHRLEDSPHQAKTTVTTEEQV